jgi:RNA polymerase sigma factor (sigma-70 family)
MATRQLSGVLRQMCDVMLGEHGCGDGQLLERYLTRREEAAFEALVRRHGPMVLGVCRRVLRNCHDAEDAFQATFLVLVRKAASIRPREQVGNWLYGVAYRTALKARAVAARQSARERMRPRHELIQDEPAADWLELLDEEFSKLPDKYRAPVLLCDLRGKTRKEAARLLGWPEGTLSTRLARARSLLGQRLARRGVTLSGGAAMALAGNAASAKVPPALVGCTMKAAVCFSTGQRGAAGVASAKVVALTEGVLKTMFLTKLKSASAVVLALLALGLGFGAGAYHSFPAAAADQGGGVQPDGLKSEVKVVVTERSRVAYGRTAPGEGWKPYGTTEEQAAQGIYIDVDTSAAKFKSVPVYITSLGGESAHWEVTGISAIYPREDQDKKLLPLQTGFRIYLRFRPSEVTPLYNLQEASKKWYVNWVAYGE